MANGGGRTAQAWEDRWQERIENTQTTHTKQLQDVSLILERTVSRLDEHDRRIKALEEAPKEARQEARAWFDMANTGIGTILGALALLVTILFTILPHLSFH